MNLVVDANVVIKVFVEEPHSEIARELFAGNDSLIAPGHFLGEVGEVLVRRVRAGEVAAGQLDIARTLVLNTIEAVAVGEVFDPAFAIAEGATISFYDALYVATAERWDTLLVTADRKMIASLSGTRWTSRVISLADWPTRQRRMQ